MKNGAYTSCGVCIRCRVRRDGTCDTGSCCDGFVAPFASQERHLARYSACRCGC